MALTEEERKKKVAALFGGKDYNETGAKVGSNWEKPGKYLMLLKAVRLDDTAQQGTGMFFEQVCCHVIEENPDAPAETHKPGDEVTLALWAKHGKTFFANVKGQLGGWMELDKAASDAITMEEIDMVTAQDQPLRNTFAIKHNRTILTREKKTPFTLVTVNRVVSATEAAAMMSPEAIAAVFPKGPNGEPSILERLIEQEGGSMPASKSEEPSEVMQAMDVDPEDVPF